MIGKYLSEVYKFGLVRMRPDGVGDVVKYIFISLTGYLHIISKILIVAKY